MKINSYFSKRYVVSAILVLSMGVISSGFYISSNLNQSVEGKLSIDKADESKSKVEESKRINVESKSGGNTLPIPTMVGIDATRELTEGINNPNKKLPDVSGAVYTKTGFNLKIGGYTFWLQEYDSLISVYAPSNTLSHPRGSEAIKSILKFYFPTQHASAWSFVSSNYNKADGKWHDLKLGGKTLSICSKGNTNINITK